MKNKRQALWYISAFLLPLILFVFALFMCDVVPFGENTLLVWDGEAQWGNFYAYLKTIFDGENDIFYSFSKVLGGDMYSLIAYYLASPYFILFAFFDTIQMPLAVTVITALKIATCGLTCFTYLRHVFGQRDVGTLCFSTAYALMGYNIAFYMSLTWYDGVILLPLVALGIHRMMNHGKKELYVLALGGALVTNFYIGYMICLTSVIYYGAVLCLDEKPWQRLKQSVKSFVTGSLLAGGVSAFLWVPTLIAMRESRLSVTDSSIFAMKSRFALIDIFDKVFTLTNNGKEMAGGLPHIFIGIIPFFCILLFLANGEIKLRQKVIAGAVFAIYLVSFNWEMLNSIWHGFSINSAYNYRESFCLSFFLLIMAYQGFLNIKSLSLKALAGAIAGFWVFVILVFAKEFNLYVVDMKGIYWDLIVVSLAALALYLIKTADNRRRAYLLLSACAVIHLGDLTANAWYGIQEINEAYETMQQSEYEEFYQKVMPAVAQVAEEDAGFYRMEKTFAKESCDPMLFAYNGMTHYSSAETAFSLEFVQKLGYKKVWLSGDYSQGATRGADSLMGIKYLLAKAEEPLKKDYILKNVTEEGIAIYENPNVLPVAFVIGTESAESETAEAVNKFEYQNQIWQSIYGEAPLCIYTPAEDIAVESVNMWESAAESGGMQYEPKDQHEKAYVEYSFINSREEPVYLYMSGTTGGLEYSVNGELLKADPTEEIVLLGTFATGECVDISISIKQDKRAQDVMKLGDAVIYYENSSALQTVCGAVKERSAGSLQKISSSVLEGTIHVQQENASMVFTIPYSAGWKIWVDGNEVEAEKIWSAMMALPVEKGEHSYRMVYRPVGLAGGIVISIASFMLLLVNDRVWKKKKAKPE